MMRSGRGARAIERRNWFRRSITSTAVSVTTAIAVYFRHTLALVSNFMLAPLSKNRLVFRTTSCLFCCKPAFKSLDRRGLALLKFLSLRHRCIAGRWSLDLAVALVPMPADYPNGLLFREYGCGREAVLGHVIIMPLSRRHTDDAFGEPELNRAATV